MLHMGKKGKTTTDKNTPTVRKNATKTLRGTALKGNAAAR